MDRESVGMGALVQAGDAVNRPAAALLLALVVGLLGCESADDDQAQANVTTKPAQVTATKEK